MVYAHTTFNFVPKNFQFFHDQWARGLTMQANFGGKAISVSAPVFLADMDHANARLRLHVRAGISTTDVQARAQAALDSAGQPIEVVVRSHDLRQLAYPRSLEHWVNRFQLGEVIHDPTMIVGRARALMRAATACRDAMGGQVRGVFFDPTRRTLLVLVRAGRDGVQPSTRSWVRSLVDEAWQSAGEAVHAVSVQAVGSLPAGDVVPVDAASSSVGRRVSSTLRRWLAPIALLLAAGSFAGPAAAKADARQPAFSSGSARLSDTAATPHLGMLPGLSVFADGRGRVEMDAFASSGLKMFFGEVSGRGGIQLAQSGGRTELFDVGPGVSSPGS